MLTKELTKIPIKTDLSHPNAKNRQNKGTEKLIKYYSEAGLDYKTWSSNFNMHFGFYRLGINPFNLESMLEQMNHEVLKRLHMDTYGTNHLLDMGCGMGATARSVARFLPNTRITGITIVPCQVDQARQLTAPSLRNKIHFTHGDYTDTGFVSNSFDGIYAIESSCYANGYAKHDFLKEAHRLLKPGQRVVIADGFLKTTDPMNFFMARCYQTICECWALETFAALGPFVGYMEKRGFQNIMIEDIAHKIAPSVFHIPIKVLRFFLDELTNKGRKMTRERWNNLIAPLLSFILGAARNRFSDYIISARKA